MRSKTQAKRAPYGAVSGDFERQQQKASKKRGTQAVAAGRVKKQAPATSGPTRKNGGGQKKKRVSSSGNVAVGDGDRELGREGFRRSPRNHQPPPPAALKTKKKAGTQGVAKGRVKKSGQPVCSTVKKVGGARKKTQVPSSGSAASSDSDKEPSRLRPRRSPRNHLPASGPADRNGAGPKKMPVTGRGKAKKKSAGAKKRMPLAGSGTKMGGGVRKKPAAGNGGVKKKGDARKKVGAADSGKAATGESARKSGAGRSTRNRLPPLSDAQMADWGPDAGLAESDSEVEAQIPDWGPCVACNSHDKLNRPMDKDLYRMIRRWRLHHGLCYYTAVGDRATLPAGEALKGQYICTACTRVIGRLVAKARHPTVDGAVQ